MTRQLPLHEFHQRLGAAFQERHGWMVPGHYGDVEAEYQAVRAGAGVLDRSHTGKVEVFGRDRVSFLHGMLTNDLKGLSPGEGCAAAFLDHHGKVQALLNVYCLEDRLLLSLPPGLVEKTLALLDKFLISERVEFRDVTEQHGCLSVQGPESARILSAFVGEPSTLPFGRHMERSIDEVAVRFFGTTETGEEGFQLWVAVAQLPMIWSRLIGIGGSRLKPVGESALNVLRVEAGIPWCPDDLNEDILFMEAESQLESFVSFTKGCYIGQEVVARIKYRGHVNRRLTGLTFLNEMAPGSGAKVFGAGNDVGWVTSAVFSQALKRPIALAFLRREVDVGADVEVRSDASALSAKVCALPFYHR
ncbi:MAG TPA: aminomethyltransferase family protein [Methylomirabilota bacterium]|nr:aminomethyltransferase family protein [Methylomirabilota bacterium]